MSASTRIPAAPLWLGLGGLLPFWVSALMMWVQAFPFGLLGSLSLTGYGAVILSFLGGVRWGEAVTRAPETPPTSTLILSVLPSILGWLALLAVVATFVAEGLPIETGLVLLIAGFVAQGWWDVRGRGDALLPDWYPRLRLILSAGAIAALLVGLLAIRFSLSA